jgi:VWFA-related protein
MTSAGRPAALLVAALASAATAQDVRRRESVTVESVVVDARVVDDRGRPILGLGPSDFRVKVDGREVELQSATWMAGGAPLPEAARPAALAAGVPLPPPGRLILFVFQKDLHPSRAPGLMHMLVRAREMADGFAPDDRVAVASFDSRLRLWLDFTTDRARLRRVLEHSILFGRHPLLNVEDFPSLAEHFDATRAKNAATLESALLVLADALRPLPGTKSLALFGWGMGRWSPGVGVSLDSDYEEARRAMSEARVTVFALDVTNADYHTLEVGLQQVAEDTGGFYARTHVFSGQAMDRLEHALAGHYVLTFAKPDLRPGDHVLDVTLVGRKGNVLAKKAYQG